jgi:hypothetical protein
MIRTLITANFALVSSYALALWTMSMSTPALTGIRALALAYTVGAIGSVLAAARGHISDLLSVIVSNALVLLTAVLMDRAIRQSVFARFQTQRVGTALLALLIIALCYFTLVDNSVSARIFVLSTAVAVQTALTGYVLIRYAEPGVRFAARSLGSGFLAFSAFNLLRAAVSLKPGMPADYMRADWFQALSVLAYMIESAWVAFGFIWLANARLQVEL